MTNQEFENKKEELRNLVEKADTEEKIAEIEEKLRNLQNEKIEDSNDEKKDGEISHEEERSLIADTDDLEKRSTDLSKLKKIGGKEEMEKEERKFTKDNVLKSDEYRSAWAKKLMCREDFNEEEKRALDVAVTTTATTYKAPSGDADGVNNGGLFIPESVSLEILKEIELESPFLRDVAKTHIKGLISFPYKNEGSGVDHPEEGKDTKLEADEYATLTFGQYELAKTVRITWKLEAMAVEDFIRFIIEEISREMREDLGTQALYGDGNNTLKGATVDAIDAEYEATTNALDAIHDGLAKLPKRKKSGAKIYIAEDMALDIAFLKDENGMYINNPVNGVGLDNVARYKVEVDPTLKDGDFLIGNSRWYKMNFNEGISVTKDIIGRARVNDYTGYAVVGGAPIPGSFVHGKKKAK